MQKINSERTLRPLKLGKRSKEFFVFDTETGIEDETGNIQYLLSARPEHLIFGVVYGKYKGKYFHKVLFSAAEFVAEFKKKKYKNKLVYAHNAEYDLSAVYGNIYLMDNNAIFNGKFICATNGNAMFVDSFNLLPTSVKKLGALLGLNKMQLGDGNLVSHRKRIKYDISYCLRDCKIVYKSLQKMFTDTEPSYTIGSHSVKVFRKNYLQTTIRVPGIADRFFDCMYGGRTEAFKIGKCDGKVYDINSAYPFAMLQNLPDVLRLRKYTEKEFGSILLNTTFGGMITATVTIPDNCALPVLPFKSDGKLLFPVGTFSGSWTMNEFAYAIEYISGMKYTIHEIIAAPLIESPFIDFVNDIYTLRSKTENEFLRLRYKLELNNLYGKLVQRLREEWKFFTNQNDIVKYLRKHKIRSCELTEVVGGYFAKYEVNKIYNHTIPVWGAYITAFVRVILHKKMAEHLPDLLYCDTDSVFLSKSLNLNESKLGGWKREQKRIKEIRTLKDYVFVDSENKTQRMLKGVKADAAQLTNDGKIFTYKRMIRTRESLRRVDLIPPGTFITQIKFVSGDYNKRIVNKDGSTKPFKLCEPDRLSRAVIL